MFLIYVFTDYYLLIKFTALFSNSVQSLLTNIESFDDGTATEVGADKTKLLFARFTTTTTSTAKPFLTLILGLNTDALPMGTVMVMNSS